MVVAVCAAPALALQTLGFGGEIWDFAVEF